MGAYRRQVKFPKRRVPRRHSKYIAGTKLNATVLFVVIFVIVCIVGTVALGNYLKEKADQNRPSILDTSTKTEEDTTKTSSGVSSIDHADGHIRSGCLDISYGSDNNVLENELRNLFASGFDSVTLPIEKNGSLLYYFPAASALSYISPDTELPSLTKTIEIIKSIGAEYGIEPTVTAYYKLSAPETEDPVLTEASYLFDTAIISEAYSLGADEVLVSGFKTELDSDEILSEIMTFIEKLKSSSPEIKIGFAFAPEIYFADQTAQALEKISAEISFLAIDTSDLDWTYSVTKDPVYTTDENGNTTETVETIVISQIYGQIEKILSDAKGSISLYGLRFVLDGTYTYTLSEAIDALYSKGVLDFYVASTAKSAFAPISPDTSDSKSDLDSDSQTTSPSRPTNTGTAKPETTKPETTETVPVTETVSPEDSEPVPPETTEPETTESETSPNTETETETDTPETSSPETSNESTSEESTLQSE